MTKTGGSSIVVSHLHLPQQFAMAQNQFKALEQKINELIALCQELDRENQELKQNQVGWRRERKDLIDKNELARNKVEAMIDRLRTLEP